MLPFYWLKQEGETMKLVKGAVLAGRYEIIEQIGSGGMALVYRAKDKKLGRDVTFKVLREEYCLDEDFLSRFNVEARSAASLSHPNIVNVYDVGSEGEINYIVMEYIDGVTLKDLILKRAPFENEETLGVAIQIASALSHAHKNGIIHRDIKPQNILVTKAGTVKVTDFGIARSVGNKTTTTSTNTMGSVHYFSPEQAKGRYVDFRSDIYSLGIVMFEMATGSVPYNADTAITVALKHLNEPLPDMVKINPAISESLKKIILKACSKQTLQRYASADEMLIDLKRAITNESGEFVKYNERTFDSPTIMLGEEDIGAIRGGAYARDSEDHEYDEDYDDGEYYDDEIDKKTERKIVLAAVFTAIAIIALISAIGLKLHTGKSKQYALTDLTGYTVEEAKKLLAQHDITIGKEEEGYSDAVEPGKIMDQSPEEGTLMNKEDTIKVTVSKGENKIEVPNFVGMERSEVYNMEEVRSGFLIIDETEPEYNDDYEINKVVYQSVNKGEKVSKNTKIKITLSRGKKMEDVIVPNLLNRSESEAKRLILESGLEIGIVSPSYSNEYPEGRVCAQSVPGGETVKAETAIGIYISMGPKPSEQPGENQGNENNSQTPGGSQNNNDGVKYGMIVIPAPPQANEGYVEVEVIQKNEDGSELTIYPKTSVTADDFPLQLNIKGSGKADISAFADGIMYAKETFDFNKGGN